MKFLVTTFILSFFTCLSVFAQTTSTSALEIQNALMQKQTLKYNSLVKNVEFRNIGPTVMSGRVVDLDVNPDNPSEFYVGYASGGVWHTLNNGTTFTPILDNAPTQNVGDIAVDWKTKTIWVGTGENNSSRSSYAGIGLLKSTDNGKSWENMGLHDSHHIGRIVINPNNPDELIVGVTGHLYSPNKERGVYKTTDGGKTWSQKLFVDSVSGIIDIAYAPNNFNVMFATSWTKDRKAWNFTGSGNNSAIYKSIDAGDTWIKITTEKSGFPTGEGVGRIGVAVYDENTIYAIHDNQFRRPKEKKNKEGEGLLKDDFKNMSVSDLLNLDDDKLNTFLKQNGFHKKYKSDNVKALVRKGSIKPIDIANYLEDANSLLFDTPVVGTEVYVSTDGGTAWNKTHDDYLDNIYYSYGYYFGHIYVSPVNTSHIYIYGVPILKSKDGGKTFQSISAENVHGDHHALWINPNNPNHLINGNDGGVNISYDDGENWIKNNSPSVGQFYAINIDHESPYNVYGGLQDNGVWVGPNNAKENKSWHQSGHYPWESIMGGDGMQVQIDSRNSNIIYTGFQFGNYYRINRETEETQSFNIKHQLGEAPYRFNWQTPIVLSSHNQDIVYFGGNKLFRSMDQGNTWEAISEDLTQGGKKGNVAYGTLTSISESPFQFGLLYAGSDDGLVHITKDGGNSWKRISDNFPKDLWVSRVIASNYKKERVYVTLNGYRWDDFKVYVFVSEDYGNTWNSITSNIPLSPVNVIREDPENEQLLYLGTDNGAYVSFNTGKSWEAFSMGLPNVAVHDIVVQPEAKELLLGTHGRSIYKTRIAELQEYNPKSTEAVTLFELPDLDYSKYWGTSRNFWSEPYETTLVIPFYSKAEKQEVVDVLSQKGTLLQSFTVNAAVGFNYVDYNMSITKAGAKSLTKEDDSLKLDTMKKPNDNYYLPKGKYSIRVGTQTETFTIK